MSKILKYVQIPSDKISPIIFENPRMSYDLMFEGKNPLCKTIENTLNYIKNKEENNLSAAQLNKVLFYLFEIIRKIRYRGLINKLSDEKATKFEIYVEELEELIQNFIDTIFFDHDYKFNRAYIFYDWLRYNKDFMIIGDFINKLNLNANNIDSFCMTARKISYKKIKNFWYKNAEGITYSEIEDFLSRLLSFWYKVSNNLIASKLYYQKLYFSKRLIYTKISAKKPKNFKKNMVNYFAVLGIHDLEDDPLDEFQETLSEVYLENLTDSNPNHAYTIGRSIKTCAEPHINAKFLVRVDIRHFFESIKPHHLVNALEPYFNDQFIKKVIGLSVFDGSLRLGIKTSPILSNFVGMKYIDNVIEEKILPKYKDAYDLTYTRYCDDLFFSSNSDEYFSLDLFINDLDPLLKKNGFALNSKKSKIYTSKNGLRMLSMTLQSESLSVSKKYRRHIVRQLIDISKYYPSTRHENRLKSILGKIMFIDQINHAQALKLKKIVLNIFKDGDYKKEIEIFKKCIKD